MRTVGGEENIKWEHNSMEDDGDDDDSQMGNSTLAQWPVDCSNILFFGDDWNSRREEHKHIQGKRSDSSVGVGLLLDQRIGEKGPVERGGCGVVLE